MSLRDLLAQTPKPVIGHSNGMLVAVQPAGVVQFPDEFSARFFIAAHAELPNLLDELEELERRQDPGLVDGLVTEIASLKRELERATLARMDLERVLAQQAEDLARANRGVATGVRVARQLVETTRECKALRAELDAARSVLRK